MASSSSSSLSSQIRRYHVFPSFHGPDVRKGFLSHLHNHFASKGIRTFKDQEIERGNTIGPELVQAIRESRVSIVVLSKKYTSSSWCLDELVEIFNCKEDHGQIVMTIFYDVDPSDVRKQSGDFGSGFEKTCQGKTEEVKQRWRKALTDVANIEGEHSLNWANEAEMIQTIATDVSNKLNVTPSKDFDEMVGREAHMKKLDSLLCLGEDNVKMIGIWGPAGIGKTTIARALFSQISGDFQLSCFMGNLKESYKSNSGDNYDWKLNLQKKLLSEILNQNDVKIHHLGAIKEWLQDQGVLIILDDVDDLEQLEVLAKELSWFGNGSRIIVTTEDKKILKAHGIHDVYHVDFPSKKAAIEILSHSAFKQSSVPDGFEDLANKVAAFCGNLPLALCVVGSSLRGESKQGWESQLSWIEISLDRKIEDVLRVGYDRLSKKDQSIFLHISCFFSNEVVGHVTSLLSESHPDVENRLKTLADRSLVHIYNDGYLEMHQLLQKLGRQIVVEQSEEPEKRQFLLEAEEIRDVLANETGTGSVLGISFDTSNISDFLISKGAFEGMRNLRYLRIYDSLLGGQGTLQIPKDMEYLPRLRLLHWNKYQGGNLPSRFQPEHLVEIHMPYSRLKKLWAGIQPLPNLKSIDLSYSDWLKELPNLSKATNLEKLSLDHCSSLVKLWEGNLPLPNLKSIDLSYSYKLKEIPNLSNAGKLETVKLISCKNIRLVKLWDGIQPVPNLKRINLSDCYKLKEIPNLSNATNLEELDTGSCIRLVELPSTISNLHKLVRLDMSGCSKLQTIPTNINLASLEKVDMRDCSRLRTFPDISKHIKNLNVSNTKIEEVPPLIAGWSRLESLNIGITGLERLADFFPQKVKYLDLSNTGIIKIPDCIRTLPHLERLYVRKCPKLVTIQALPRSLELLEANECVSLNSVCCSFRNPLRRHMFINCFKLDEGTRRGIIQQSIYDYICLPAREIPAEFTHRLSKSIAIPLARGTFSASSRFKACFLMLPSKGYGFPDISCTLRSEGVTVHSYKKTVDFDHAFPSEHLLIFHGDLFRRGDQVDVTMTEIVFEFSCRYDDEEKIKACGVQIMTEKPR